MKANMHDNNPKQRKKKMAFTVLYWILTRVHLVKFNILWSTNSMKEQSLCIHDWYSIFLCAINLHLFYKNYWKHINMPDCYTGWNVPSASCGSCRLFTDRRVDGSIPSSSCPCAKVSLGKNGLIFKLDKSSCRKTKCKCNVITMNIGTLELLSQQSLSCSCKYSSTYEICSWN